MSKSNILALALTLLIVLLVLPPIAAVMFDNMLLWVFWLLFVALIVTSFQTTDQTGV